MIHLDPPDFGDLRSMLAAPPSAQGWAALVKLVERWDSDALEDGVLRHVLSHLERWPDATRLAPRKWVERSMRGATVKLWPMARGLNCEGMVLGAKTCQHISTQLLSERLHVLSAHGAHISHEALTLLLEAESTTHLTHLDLKATPLNTRCMRALTHATTLGALEQLVLAGCQMGNDGIGVLTNEHAALPALRSLDLCGARLGLLALKHLVSAPFAPQLEQLVLDDNHFGRHGAGLLARAGAVRALHTLSLRDCGLGPEGIEAMCEEHAFERLRELDLKRNALRSEGLIRLAHSSLLQHVEVLHLGTNRIGDDGIEALVASDHIPNLRRVVLHWNPVTARSRDLLDERGIRHDLKESDWESRWLKP